MIQRDFGEVLKPHPDDVLNRLSCTTTPQTTNKCDVLLTPVTLDTAPLYSEFTQADNRQRCEESDVLTTAANMAGLPAISVPVTLHNNMPVGMQLMAGNYQENTLFKAARFLQQKANFTVFKS